MSSSGARSTYQRRLLTSLGQIAVTIPRTRASGSTSDVVGRYQRRTDDIDALLTSAYVNGVSTRKAGELTEALLGARVSRSTVSRVTKQLDAQVDALQRAPIDGAHPYLYLDATFVDVRWARTVENVSALIAYGVGADGHRQLLGVALGVEESEASWAELLQQLQTRADRAPNGGLFIGCGNFDGATTDIVAFPSADLAGITGTHLASRVVSLDLCKS